LLVRSEVGNYVVAADADDFLTALWDKSIDLFVVDPPHFRIVPDARNLVAAAGVC
jgi:predicted methyltransferase